LNLVFEDFKDIRLERKIEQIENKRNRVMATSTKSASIEAKKCVTPEFRVSFPAIFEPKSFNNQDAKYSTVMLFDKKTDLSGLKKAAANAAGDKWGPDRTKWPKNLKMPFRDGDTKSDKEGYESCIFVTATSKTQPGLVDQSLKPILNPKDFYAGCYARAELIAFAYDMAGNMGVSFSLQNIQKLRDGKSFSGRKDASAVFDAVEDSSESADSYSNDEASLGF
jgi:hypothetical protein